jgi:hypothetical protein
MEQRVVASAVTRHDSNMKAIRKQNKSHKKGKLTYTQTGQHTPLRKAA